MKKLLLTGLLLTSFHTFGGVKESCLKKEESSKHTLDTAMKVFMQSRAKIGVDNKIAFSGFLETQKLLSKISGNRFMEIYNECNAYTNITRGYAYAKDLETTDLADSADDFLKLEKLYGLNVKMYSKFNELAEKLRGRGSRDDVRNIFIPLAMEVELAANELFKEALQVINDDSLWSPYEFEIEDRGMHEKNQAVEMKIKLKEIFDSMYDYLNNNE